MAQFFGDQVSEKVALTLGDYLTGLVFFATAAVIGFVPVLLALVGRRTGDIGWRASRPLPGPVLLMGAWIITCIAVFAFSNFRVGRYMLPAMPALAALLALGFTGMSEAQLARRCGRAVRILVPLAGGVAILSGLILYMARMDAALWAWALGAAIFLGAVWWLAGRLGATAAAAAMVAILPGSVLMFLPGYFVLGTPSAADLALKALREGGFQPSEVYVLRRWHLVERVGLRLPPLQDYIFANDLDPALLSQARILIATSPADAEALQSLGWQTRIEHGTPEGFSASAFWEAVVTRDIAAFRKRHGEPLLIATRE